MSLGTQVFIWRRRITGYFRRAFTRLRRPTLTVNSNEAPEGSSKFIWSTQVVASGKDELRIARENLVRLKPFIAWAGLTIDGTPAEPGRFPWQEVCDGFQNIVWLSRPEVVSRQGHCATYGHFNRHTLNYMRGWLANLEVGEECDADLFFHNDGDWEIEVQPETIKRLRAFFHRYPEVVAISRSLDDFLVDEPGMWADKDSDGQLWFCRGGMLSSNLVISPIDRIRSLLLKVWEIFPMNRGLFMEQILRRLVMENGQVIAYPTTDYFRDQLLIGLSERRKPFEHSE
jgi:hypothetical protein